MMNEENLVKFKKTTTFSKIANGVKSGQLKEVILGLGTYAMSLLPISTSTDSGLVITALHILIKEKITTNKDLNIALDSIVIEKQNVCLLLDYVLSYLLYRKSYSVVEFDYNNIIKKIIINEEYYKDLTCYNRLLSLIHDALKELKKVE